MLKIYCDVKKCGAEINPNIQESKFFFQGEVAVVDIGMVFNSGAPIQASPKLNQRKINLCEKCFSEALREKL